VKIFDFHVRLTAQPHALERLLGTMEDTGIERAAVAAGGVVGLDVLSRQLSEGGWVDADADNAYVLQQCQAYPDRLASFWFGNPHRDPAEYKALASQYHGLELSPGIHGVPFDDPRTHRYVEIAAEAGHPVYVVCVGAEGMRAADLARLAKDFPQTEFVFGHCGFTGIDVHGLAQIAPVPNISAETSGCFTLIARLALERLGVRRLIFATEFPLQHPSVELAKFAAIGVTPTEWEQIAWHNARRLLRQEG
jgi:predicted TIM-barrel fold metal-dependent hydrolase